MPTLTLEEPQVVEQVKTSLDEWKEEGQAIFRYYDGARNANATISANITRLHWKIGDWLAFGEREFKQQAIDEALRVTGRKLSTLWDFIRTSRAFEDRSRRRESLSWSHHKELAVFGLTPAVQDQLLAHAEKYKLSVQKLRVKAEQQSRAVDEDYRERVREEKTHKVVKVFVPAKSLTWIKRLASARRRSGGELIYKIAADYFQEHKAEIEDEIEKYEAPLRKLRAERMAQAKEKKSKLDAGMKEKSTNPRWKDVQVRIAELTRLLANRTGDHKAKNGEYLRDYIEAECGTRDFLSAPIEVYDKLLEAVAAADDAPGKLHILKQLAIRPKNLPEIKLKPR